MFLTLSELVLFAVFVVVMDRVSVSCEPCKKEEVSVVNGLGGYAKRVPYPEIFEELLFHRHVYLIFGGFNQ